MKTMEKKVRSYVKAVYCMIITLLFIKALPNIYGDNWSWHISVLQWCFESMLMLMGLMLLLSIVKDIGFYRLKIIFKDNFEYIIGLPLITVLVIFVWKGKYPTLIKAIVPITYVIFIKTVIGIKTFCKKYQKIDRRNEDECHPD